MKQKTQKKNADFNIIFMFICTVMFIGSCVLSGLVCDKTDTLYKRIEYYQSYVTMLEDTVLDNQYSIMEKLEPSALQQLMTDYSTVNTNELLIIDESQLTEEMLLNRNGKLIISKCVGKVVSEEKDGCIINKAQDKEYDYISYRCVKDAQIDDIIVTYLVYNPDNNYTDDIIHRFDYIVSRNNQAE